MAGPLSLYIIIFISVAVYVSLEVIRSKLMLDEYNKKSRELMKKVNVKNPQELDEDTLKEILEIHKQMYKYMISSSLILILVLIILTFAFKKEKILILPFTLPIINKNWLGAIGTYILCYFIVSIIGAIIKKIYKSFIRKKANGEESTN